MSELSPVRQARKAHRITQEQAAAALGISRVQYIRKEKANNFTLKDLQVLSSLFPCTISLAKDGSVETLLSTGKVDPVMQTSDEALLPDLRLQTESFPGATTKTLVESFLNLYPEDQDRIYRLITTIERSTLHAKKKADMD